MEARCKDTLERLLYNDVNHSVVVPESFQAKVDKKEAHYALLPVWMLTTKWKDKDYLFAMNGQTGKMIGDTLPKDGMKMLRQFVIVLVVCLAISAAILYTLFMTGGN